MNFFCIGKDQLEELRKTKKVKEPVLTAEEKASITNKADIKFTGRFILKILTI